MSTPILWMKFIFFILIILIYFIELNNGQEVTNINMVNQPVNYQDRFQTKDMVSNCQPESDQYCYLTEAVEWILFGEKKNKTDIDEFLDNVNDNDTLDSVLQLGFDQLHLFAQDNPTLMPGKIEKETKTNKIERTFFFLLF